MPTGIANAIIYIRGVDLLSKPIQRAAAEANAGLKRLWKDQSKDMADLARNKEKIISLTRSIATQEQKAAMQLKAYATQDLGLRQRIDNLNEEGEILGALRFMMSGTPKEGTIAWERNEAAIHKNIRAQKLAENQLVNLRSKMDLLKTTTATDLGIKRETIANLTNVNKGLDQTINKLRMLEIASAQARATVANFQASLGRLQSTLSSVGLMATAVVTASIVGAFTAATKSFADYEASLRNIQAIGRQTDAEMSTLSNTFLNMSKDITQTIASPKELAEAFYEVQSAGFYGADAMRILSASTRAATAGLADQKEVAKALAMALHAYGVGTAEATHYTDVMMRAVDIGIFRFEDLTAQMGDFIAAAGMMDVPIEEVMAALTAMTKKGIPIAEAATSLNRIMMNYLKPAKKEIDLAKEYGIELSANTLKTKGFAGAMTEMLEKTKDNEDVLANLIGEVRGIRGVFALGSDGLKMYNQDLQTLYKSAGTVASVFAIQMKSLSAQFKNLKNAVTVLAISFGKVLLPVLTNFIQKTLLPLITKLSQLPDSTKIVIMGFAALVAAIGPLLIASSTLVGVLNGVITLLVRLGATKVLASIFSVFAGAGSAFAIFAGAVAILAGAIGAFIALENRWENASSGFAKTLDDLSRKSGVIGGVATGLELLFEKMRGFNVEVANMNAAQGIGDAFSQLAEKSRAAMEKLDINLKIPDMADILEFVLKTIAKLAAGFRNLAAEVQIAVTFILQVLSEFAEPFIGLGKIFTDLFNIAKWSFNGIGAAIRGAITGKLDTSYMAEVEGQLTSFTSDLKNTWNSIGPVSLNAIETYADEYAKKELGLADILYREIEAIDKLDLSTPIRNKLSGAAAAFDVPKPKGWFGKEIKPEQQALFDNALLTIQAGRVQDVINNLKGGMSGLGNAAADAANKAKSAWGGVLDNVKGKFDDAVGKANELGSNLPGVADIWKPGANGPFEPLYRIMALADGIQGEQEQMWAKMYNVNEEQSKRISMLFKEGKYYLPEVSQYIDKTALAEALNAEESVKEAQNAFIAEFGKQAGIPADAIASWMEGKGDSLKLATDKFATSMVTNLGVSLKGIDTAGAMIGFAGNTFASFEEEFLKLAGSSDLWTRALQSLGISGQAGTGVAPTWQIGVPNGASAKANTNNISLNVSPGAVQVTSDNANEVANQILAIIFAELSKAEQRAGIPAPTNLPGVR